MHTNHKKVWKYCYWLDDDCLARLKSEMQDKGVEMTGANYAPCEVSEG